MKEKLKFVYLTYVVASYGTSLVACHSSPKKAKAFMDPLPGRYLEDISGDVRGKRVLQKLTDSDHIYYTEKHVLMD